MSSTIEQEPIHDRQGSVWDYISPSRLALFCKCPLAFKLRYLDGIRTPTSPALFVGKVVHAGLEQFYRHRMLGLSLEASELAGQVVTNWDQAAADEQMLFESTDQEAKLRSQAVDLVRTYLAQVPADEPKPLAVEATMDVPLVDPITGEDLGIPLLGVVDLILDADAGPLICDFKTSSKSAPPYEVNLREEAYETAQAGVPFRGDAVQDCLRTFKSLSAQVRGLRRGRNLTQRVNSNC